MYKLLAVDVDGTLLNDNGVISDITKRAIKEAVNKGIIFVISSGRPIQGVLKVTEQLNIDMPVITYNGAMVITGNSMNVLYSCNLEAEHAIKIYNLGLEKNTDVMVWSNNKLYVNRISDRAIKYSSLTGVNPIILNDIHKTASEGITKILWYDDLEKMNLWLNEFDFMKKEINIHTSQPIFLEFVNKNASKAIALQKLGEHYNIKKEEMIAVGDGLNDISMIEYAGVGIAMGNANDKVKSCADYVTLTNNENGVYYVINRFILSYNNI